MIETVITKLNLYTKSGIERMMMRILEKSLKSDFWKEMERFQLSIQSFFGGASFRKENEKIHAFHIKKERSVLLSL